LGAHTHDTTATVQFNKYEIHYVICGGSYWRSIFQFVRIPEKLEFDSMTISTICYLEVQTELASNWLQVGACSGVCTRMPKPMRACVRA